MKTVIAVSGKARVGKTTFANLAQTMGCDIVDISKFLARMTVARLEMAGQLDLDIVDARKDWIAIDARTLRQHIIDTGNALDHIIPMWVVSEILRSDKDTIVIPSVKDMGQVASIKLLAGKLFRVKTLEIVNSRVPHVSDVRTPFACNVVIDNNSSKHEFYDKIIAYFQTLKEIR